MRRVRLWARVPIDDHETTGMRCVAPFARVATLLEPAPGRVARRLRGNALTAAIALAAVALGCQPAKSIERPSDAVIRATLSDILAASDPSAIAPERLAILEQRDTDVVYREPTSAEMAALWLTPPITAFEIGEVRCQYHPVWRIAFRPTGASGVPGPTLVSEIVPIKGRWHVLARPRIATTGAGGEVVPDFAPSAGVRAIASPGQPTVLVVTQPPWTDLRMEER